MGGGQPHSVIPHSKHSAHPYEQIRSPPHCHNHQNSCKQHKHPVDSSHSTQQCCHKNLNSSPKAPNHLPGVGRQSLNQTLHTQQVNDTHSPILSFCCCLSCTLYRMVQLWDIVPILLSLSVTAYRRPSYFATSLASCHWSSFAVNCTISHFSVHVQKAWVADGLSAPKLYCNNNGRVLNYQNQSLHHPITYWPFDSSLTSSLHACDYMLQLWWLASSSFLHHGMHPWLILLWGLIIFIQFIISTIEQG